MKMHPIDPEESRLKGAFKDWFLKICGVKDSYVLEWNVANAVRGAYKEHMGEYPNCPCEEQLLQREAEASR